MRVYNVYAISFACVFGVVILSQIYRVLKPRARKLARPFLRKWFLYALVFPRRSGSSDCTVLTAVALLAYVGGNTFCALSGISTRKELAERLGKLSLINMVPLYLGGRTNYIADKALGMSLSRYHFMHRWVGRVCLAHGLAHGTIRLIEGTASIDGIGIAVSESRNQQTLSHV